MNRYNIALGKKQRKKSGPKKETKKEEEQEIRREWETEMKEDKSISNERIFDFWVSSFSRTK